MENIVNYASLPLYWLQPSALKQYYELRSEDTALLGTLQMNKGFGRLNATAESGGEIFGFQATGFFRSKFLIRKYQSETPVAEYSLKMSGKGMLEFADGRSYKFASTNIWATAWAFTDTLGTGLVTVKNERKITSFSDIFKARGRVDIAPQATNLPDLPLMVTFGWYMLMVMRQRRSG